MHESTIVLAFDTAISGRRLLDHPYYQGWQQGALRAEDLGEYAGQYRHIERCLPDVLAAAAQSTGDGPARRLVEENLNDERSRPRAHVELFESFAVAVGATTGVAPSQATMNLVSRYEDAVTLGPVAVLSVIGAYEQQAAQIAATKACALREHYGLGAEGTEFWDVHAGMEQAHARWTADALGMIGASMTEVETFARASAEAWWAFLDERNDERGDESSSIALSTH